MREIVGLLGFIGSGKSTVAEMLVQDHGFVSIAFAGALKDAVAAIFDWPRHMLEGDTKQSREFRETVDENWQKTIGDIPLFNGKPVTPRYVLQLMGTEVFRNHFHSDIWVLAVLKKIEANPNTSYVITDARFQNEINLLKNIGGQLIRVKRGDEPVWFDTARNDPENMPVLYPNIHRSEWDWCVRTPDETIVNDGSLDDLRAKVNILFKG